MNNRLNFRQLEETKARILLSRAAWKSSITVCGGTGVDKYVRDRG